jgi:hypothetical protein
MSAAVYTQFASLQKSGKMMDEMTVINWQSDIRQTVEELVREKRRHILLNEARELRKATKNIGVSGSDDLGEPFSIASHLLLSLI